MPKTQETEQKISHIFGKGIAHIQDGFDQAFDWGFKKLKKIEEIPPKENEHQAIKITKKIGGFIGELGSEYYKEYEKIKKERTSK